MKISLPIISTKKFNVTFGDLLCHVGIHNYIVEQESFMAPSTGGGEIVIAWNCCTRCYRSKLIHILNCRQDA